MKKDFKCSCGCGQKLRVVKYSVGKIRLIDIGVMKSEERLPRIGIVLRSDEKGLKEFKKFLSLN